MRIINTLLEKEDFLQSVIEEIDLAKKGEGVYCNIDDSYRADYRDAIG